MLKNESFNSLKDFSSANEIKQYKHIIVENTNLQNTESLMNDILTINSRTKDIT